MKHRHRTSLQPLVRRSLELEKALGCASLALAELWYSLDRIARDLPDRPHHAQGKVQRALVYVRGQIEELETLLKPRGDPDVRAK